MFHFCNWQLWGDKRDLLAWKGLTAEVGKEEIIHELRKLGREKGLTISNARGFTDARRAHWAKFRFQGSIAARKPEAIEKRKKLYSFWY